MKRIKKLSCVAIAALALSAALGAAGASASSFELESSPATVSSSTYGSQNWNFQAGFTSCETPALSGTLSSHDTALEATPQSGAKCITNSIGNEIKSNACHFVYRPGVKTGSATFKGSVDITCPAGLSIEITGGAKACRIAIPGQTGLPATFENVGSGKERAVKVTVATSSLNYSQLSGSWCTVGSYANGFWEGSWKVQTSNGSGPVGVWLDYPTLAISGTPPQLTSTYYPVKVTGAQGTQHVITTQGGTIRCNTATLSGSASGASAQLSVGGEYAGFTVFGMSGTVAMNGCTYTLNVLNQAPSGSTYAGHADVACPAGKSITITATASGVTKCTVTIPAQTTDSEGLTFTNESVSKSIGLGLNVKGIDYHQQEGSGIGRCVTADGTDGTYTGSSSLLGSY